MELKKIDHIGILVENIETSLRFYRDQLGLPVKTIEANEEFKVRIAFLPIGEVLVELVEPFQDSPLRQYLKENGEGLHHIAFEVDDLKTTLTGLKAAGVPLLDEAPRLGGEGALVAFLDSGAANNVSIELKEIKSEKEG